MVTKRRENNNNEEKEAMYVCMYSGSDIVDEDI